MKKVAAIVIGSLIVLAIIAVASVETYRKVFGTHINTEKDSYVLFIPTGSDFDDVIKILKSDNILNDTRGFEWLAKKMNYHENVKPGRYIISKELTNKQIIKKLRSGNQDPVSIYFNKHRTKQSLAGFVSKNLEVDSAQLVQYLNDSLFLSKFNLTVHTALVIFISDKYEFYWNTSAEQLIKRMHREYIKFWNESRLKLIRENNLLPAEAITLASIVEEETNNKEEKPIIAGVYINRLKKNIKLQADPTVKFAMQDFELRRILRKHLDFDSPYNTYLVTGLPPGPICIPTKESIEAVIYAQRHDYLFFCAKGDNSGTHLFAKTYKEHLANAREYRRILDDNDIF